MTKGECLCHACSCRAPQTLQSLRLSSFFHLPSFIHSFLFISFLRGHRPSMAGRGAGAYVRLAEAPLQFRPVDTHHSVFFDEGNRQVFAVREGAPEVTVSSLRDPGGATIRLVGKNKKKEERRRRRRRRRQGRRRRKGERKKNT